LDSALLELDQPPPQNASYTGWNSVPITPDTLMLAVHHPKGDVKKASLGNVFGTNLLATQIGQTVYPAGSMYTVDWLIGIVEPGSSGSAFFTFNSARNAMQVRGTLTGGNTTCGGGPSRTFYQRFDAIFPYIASQLNAPPAPPPATNFEGLWWNSPGGSDQAGALTLHTKATQFSLPGSRMTRLVGTGG